MRATIFLLLAVIGTALPLALGVAFVADEGLDLAEFADQATANTVAVLGVADLTVSSVVFWVWMSREGPRVGIDRWWLFIVPNLLVGLSSALPLFLYARERRLAAGPETAAAPSPA